MSDGSGVVVGMDVGSTTVKAVVVREATDELLWHDYQRHETKQPEKVLEFLTRIETDIGFSPKSGRIFFTGSGGGTLAPMVGGKFVQEVQAVSLAVHKLHPKARSVVELGGQDAKVLVLKPDPRTGRMRKFSSMNDKCAGGTGAVIDKMAAKLKIAPDQLGKQTYEGIKLHPVAGKCGVFAETDINGLQKQGVPSAELMASLFEAIVIQNLTVLTRGNTLHPEVLLLGGPNRYIRGMQEAWRHNISELWAERGVSIPSDRRPEDLVRSPDQAELFAAIGAVEFGKGEEDGVGRYAGTGRLQQYLETGRVKEKLSCGRAGLSTGEEELDVFHLRYQPKAFVPASFRRGERVRTFIGIDGGSTSTKAVLLSESRKVLAKAYQLSRGNPVQDAIEVVENLREQVENQGASLEVLGVGTTGYAKDLLRNVMKADVALVETVAHAEAATQFYGEPDVIVDVGGQDIKLILLKDGRVKDFMLNTQCSAGNGYFLQSTAEGFGIPVQEYAEGAFSAEVMPVFAYGCAVFLQSDIVNFQRQGWRREEILAGLAAVLPKNIWLYVAKIPHLPLLGRRFVLQGGTQNNLAAVKAQVDYIRSRFDGTGVEPEIVVHEHCGEAGAIGAAVESMRLAENNRKTSFIGVEALREITYRTTRSEETRCYFCQNRCLRTFLDVRRNDDVVQLSTPIETKVPLLPGEERTIISTCEKGSVEDVENMRGIKAELDATKEANPNLVALAARAVWKSRNPRLVSESVPLRWFGNRSRLRRAVLRAREELKVGIPRSLNLYIYAPFFRTYLESLGVKPDHIVFSDYTSEELYREGARRGSIDPCFPSKVAVSHVHNLIYEKGRRNPLDVIFFPMLDVLTSPLANTEASNACPTVCITPETVKAAFTKEDDVFAARGIRYLNPLINLSDRALLARQMLQAWGAVLGVSEEENELAIEEGFQAFGDLWAEIRAKGRQVIEMLERENRLGIVVLGRPYHHDPGLNHGVFEELQKLGYPILSQSTLPLDKDLLQRLFGEEVAAGAVSSPLDISDVWKNTYSVSSSHKLWAAKFVARHPNLVALEVSSFKCGHDAPIFSVVEKIVEYSGTPFFSLKDIDENRPAGSLKIRVETMHYFLTRYHEELLEKRAELERRLIQYDADLRRARDRKSHSPGEDSSAFVGRSRIGKAHREYRMDRVAWGRTSKRLPSKHCP
jgi:predicted CoA-substrate-specific enzyme activase